LPRDQAGGAGSTIEHEIAGEIPFDLVRHDRRHVGHTIDDGIGEPRERHFCRIDDVALGVPFGGQRLRQHALRRRQRAARRGLHRPPVKNDAEPPVGVLHLGPLVEPAPQLRPHGAPRRLHRIERRVFENVLEQVAHSLKMGGERRSFNVARRG
jgi:hypothetical protein